MDSRCTSLDWPHSAQCLPVTAAPQFRQVRGSSSADSRSWRGRTMRRVQLHATAEALRGLGAQPRRVVLEVLVERGGALDAIADQPPLGFAGGRLRRLDRRAEESGAGEHVPDMAGQPGVVVRDDIGVELALDFVYEAG